MKNRNFYGFIKITMTAEKSFSGVWQQSSELDVILKQYVQTDNRGAVKKTTR